MTRIRIQCAWCLENLGTKEVESLKNNNTPLVSHSICPSCYSKVKRDIATYAGQKLQKMRSGVDSDSLLPAF